MKNKLNSISKDRGVILLAMLIFVFMLSFIVILFIEEIEGRIRYRAQTAGDYDLRRIAYDYLDYSYAVLSEFQTFDSGLNAAGQGWGDPLTYAPFPIEYPGVEAVVKIEDATNQLPVSVLDEESFLVFFEALGMNSYDSTRLRDAYFDWVDEDEDTRIQGAEQRDYEIDRRYMLMPPNAPIKNESEYEHIKGFAELQDVDSRFYNPGILQLFKENTTLDHDYPVNLNVASDMLFEFFRLHFGLKPDALRQFQAGDDRVLGTEDDEIFDDNVPRIVATSMGEGTDKVFGHEMKLCRINIDLLRYGSAGFHLEALIDLNVSNESESSTNENPPASETNESTDVSNSESKKEMESNSTQSDKFEILVIKENFVDSK